MCAWALKVRKNAMWFKGPLPTGRPGTTAWPCTAITQYKRHRRHCPYHGSCRRAFNFSNGGLAAQAACANSNSSHTPTLYPKPPPARMKSTQSSCIDPKLRMPFLSTSDEKLIMRAFSTRLLSGQHHARANLALGRPQVSEGLCDLSS